MVNLRVNVVRAAGENYTAPACLLKVLKSLLTLPADIVFCLKKLKPCSFGCCFNLLLRYLRPEFFYKTLRHNLKAFECKEWVTEIYVFSYKLLYVILYILGIRSNDRTVVVVVGIINLLVLIRNTRIEDELDTLSYKPCYMSVCKLCRITLGLTWN